MTDEIGEPLSAWDALPRASRARRSGDAVVRAARPWTPSVRALLRHLAAEGFHAAPVPIGAGLDADGREAVTYLPGATPHPRAWSDDAAYAVGRLLRRAHDAARTFQIPPDATWQYWYGRDLGGPGRIVGHCDVGPWNWLADTSGLPCGIIDWEFAGPVDPEVEVAHAVWLNAQLHGDDVAALHDLPDPPARARQARLICDGYGLGRAQRAVLTDRMIELAVHSVQDQIDLHGITVTAPGGGDGADDAVTWGLAWRAASASWMLRHRLLLERELMR